MSIPVSASEDVYVPMCMAEIEEAPSFTFRHATVLDKHQFHRIAVAEGLMQHDETTVRETIISELKRLFDSEGMSQNITKIESYWQANDEYRDAMNKHREQVFQILEDCQDGEDPELPPEPVLEFPQDDVEPVKALIADVRRYSERVNVMLADNQWFGVMYPRILLRMFLVSSTLGVKLVRRNDLITRECAEELIEALSASAQSFGVDGDLAASQLLAQSVMSFALRRDEEKNSSSAPSGSSSQKSSESKPSTSNPTKSNARSTLVAENGLNL